MRFKKVTKFAAKLTKQGYNVFSPITMTHPIARYIRPNEISHDQWLQIDFYWLRHCDELWVYKQKGWENSMGVKMEVNYANALGLPVKYINTEDETWV